MKSLFKYTVATLFVVAMLLGQGTSFAQSGKTATKKKVRTHVPASLMDMPIAFDFEQSAAFRQLNKSVLASRLLDDMEADTYWSHHGYGKMEFTVERAKGGKQSISLFSPTLSGKPTSGRPLGTAVLRRTVPQEDWSEFNRISFWVYPTQPGARVISMGIVLKVAQDPTVEQPYESEVFHYFLLEPDQWNHIVWEIPHLIRHRVESLEFHYRVHGREEGVAHTARFDIDQLELQQVEADYYEGWEVTPGRIATSHSGYQPSSKKTAISSSISGDTFQLLDAKTGKVVLTKKIKQVDALLGNYQVLDFSEVREPGSYLIRAEGAIAHPSRIQHNVWLESIWKSINFFYGERCGDEIPGSHDVCHRDMQVAHEGKRIVANGGWHDAGDLSQGIFNTAEAVDVMFRLAEQIGVQDTLLAARLMEEAEWGLDWLLKTRFGDGYRAGWITMDLWSDGILGNIDDVVWNARNIRKWNLQAVIAEATAARLLRQEKPQIANRSLQAAEKDWRFATEGMQSANLLTASYAVRAALALYQVTGKEFYSEEAVKYGKIILACQQKSYTSWSLPIAGFFFTSPDKKQIVHYSHASYEQATFVALSQLCEILPQHSEWIEWYAAVTLYSEYLKTASSINEPYGVTPASIYSLNESQNSDYLEQIQNGFPLGKNHFLRSFPVWGNQSQRGNSPILLAQINALSIAANLRYDSSLFDQAQSGMEWFVGKNPFAQSLIAGEGYGQLLYSPSSGNIVGALPVGIRTYFNRDIPYWPSENQSCFKEVWVHPSAYWLSLMIDMGGYSESDKHKNANDDNISLSQKTEENGLVSITIKIGATENEKLHYSLRATNLEGKNFKGWIKLNKNKATSFVLKGKMKSLDEPWVAVFIPNNNLSQREEIIGSLQAKVVDGKVHLFDWSREALKEAEENRPPLIKASAPVKPEKIVADKKSSRKNEIEIVLIPAGNFMMGSPNSERGAFDEAEVLHKVTISNPFFLGKYEVTQSEWEAVMGDNPAQYQRRPDRPIEKVSWEQCALFCNKLSRLNGYAPVYNENDWTRNPGADGFRLPTEAEWEYACRAGTTTRFSFGDALDADDAGDIYSKTLAKYLWWRGNNSPFGTKPVGKKEANPWGLHGMYGNVSEWCEDYWVTDCGSEAVVDPRGPKSGTSHAIRGGYFGSYARYCRSASRYCDAGDHYGDFDFVGFRILLPANAERIKNIPKPVTK